MKSMSLLALVFFLFAAIGQNDDPTEDETISPVETYLDDTDEGTTSQRLYGTQTVNVLLPSSLDSFTSVDREYSDTDGDDKILGGSYASPGEIPWQVNVKAIDLVNGVWQLKHYCGAAILNEYWLLSAAHCYEGLPLIRLEVAIGDHHVNRRDEGEQLFRLSMIINHELFNESATDYDIALMKITPGPNGAGIQFNSYVQPIYLPTVEENPATGTEMLVSGYGRDTTSDTTTSVILKKTIMPLVDKNLCSLYVLGKETSRFFCAGYFFGETDLCKGDSGGPAAYSRNGNYIVYGIASRATGCLLPNFPVAFTNVSWYLNWITINIGIHSDSEAQKTLPRRPGRAV